MNSIIDGALSRTKTTLFILFAIVIAGILAYIQIPKESEPDVPIPFFYISIPLDGVSPEDAERLLARPMEKELQSLEGLKEITSTAAEGYANVLLEFQAGLDTKKILQEVREKVDNAKVELPSEAEEPSVNEVNLALFPVLNISLYGEIPERTLLKMATDLKDEIETLPGVLEVDISGDREEVVEIVIDPVTLQAYNLQFEEILTSVRNNNLLVAAGAIESNSGKISVKVPGIIESLSDIQSIPIKTDGDRVVTIGDVAKIQRTYRDPETFARINGQPAIFLGIKKRVGANIIEIVGQSKLITEEYKKVWPANLKVTYLGDKSKDIRNLLSDLQNNVISAILLVMIVIIAVLGLRSGFLVGVSIPASFLCGILLLNAMGYTMNIVVLFSLIMVTGMLVDGAIVVTELADRKMAEGLSAKDAYVAASKRMAWPIIASTATTLSVFTPLMFWPGIMGFFMKYLPLTMILCLSSSLFVALIFLPALGSLFGRNKFSEEKMAALTLAENGDLQLLTGTDKRYLKFLTACLDHYLLTFLGLILIIAIILGSYSAAGLGVEFFPDVEPDRAMVNVRARGDLSIYEKDKIMRQVENNITTLEGVKILFTRTFSVGDDNMPRDTIGSIQLEYEDWDQRETSAEILEKARQRLTDVSGLIIEYRKEEGGPGEGKPVSLQISSLDQTKIEPALEQILAAMEEIGGFTDIEDNRSLPGTEWKIEVDREEAARFDTNVAMIGQAIRLITNGVQVADYRPNDTDSEIDIIVRYPLKERNLNQLNNLKLNTPSGPVPLSNFVSFVPEQKTGSLQRIGGKRVLTLQSDVAEGQNVAERLNALKLIIEDTGLDPTVRVDFKGQDEEQKETGAFLGQAFLVAMFLMTLILLTQFNSIFQTLIVLSAVALSTIGVFLGLIVTQQPFGIVMCGIGVIALAGIVVNNNIVLIDTYNEFIAKGYAAREAVLRTSVLRLRPVLLTAFTTVLGLIPMVLAMNIDLVGRSITFGAPSTQWWTQLATAIAGGLSFATFLTLVVTPCLLYVGSFFIKSQRARSSA